MRTSAFSRGFTMVELLVVIVILGILAGTLIPAVGRFLSVGDDAVSRNNLMRLGRAVNAYRSDNNNFYPSAGGTFSQFTIKINDVRETRYGRSRGWVYFEHTCPRSEDTDKSVGDGNHNTYGFGVKEDQDDSDTEVSGTRVNEDGCCTCFDAESKQGGLSPKPASWYGDTAGIWSQAQVTLINGALYEYLGNDLKAFTNPTFLKRAQEKLRVPKSKICRAYAMNVIAGADEDLYDTGRTEYAKNNGYGGGDGTNACISCGSTEIHEALRLCKSTLKAYIDSSNTAEAIPAKTALIVELDLDNESTKNANDLSGDQVWDWDEGDECMGFNHEDHGMFYAHVCFADGHVEAIRDPSQDSYNPDTSKRQRLSKWYGSGGVARDGEKLD